MNETVCVAVEVVPWLTDYFDHRGSGRLHLEERLAPGATVVDLVRHLAQRYPTFGHEVFRREELSGHVAVLLNNRWLRPTHKLDTALETGDTVTLLPAFSGGEKEVCTL